MAAEQLSTFEHFESVVASHPGVVKHVTAHLTVADAARLRGASRCVREALNRTVTTVCWRSGAPFDGVEVATSFPEAHVLHAKADTSLDLGDMITSSPLLLAKIQHLQFYMLGVPDVGSVAALLSRCTSLQSAHFDVSEGEKVEFKGRGSTPAERCADMQRQLALLCTTAPFPGAASWPLGSCLTAITTSKHLHLTAALHTPSLVNLTVHLADASMLSTLTYISRLHHTLTHATITTKEGRLWANPDPAPVLHSMAALTNLRALSIRSRLAEAEHSWGDLPPSFTELTALTHVYLNAGGIHLQHLTALRAVQHLDVMRASTIRGNLAELFALSRLTTLRGSFTERPEVLHFTGVQRGAAAPEAAVPAAWRAGLQELIWSCRDACCTLPLLAQLSGLTALHLGGVRVTPEACRVLCSLQRLGVVGLPYIIAPDNELRCAASPPPPHLRPKLLAGALPGGRRGVRVGHGKQSIPALHVLARNTELPAPVYYVGAYDHAPLPECLAVKGWTANWLVSALNSTHFIHMPVVLVDDEDVELYLAALEAAAPCAQAYPRAVAHLGEAVTPAAFGRLLRSSQLPNNTLVLQEMPDGGHGHGAEDFPYVVGWTANLQLTSGHFTQLRDQEGGTLALEELVVGGGQLLDDEAVAALAAAAPELREVALCYAFHVGDAGLDALISGCRKLQSVVLTDPLEVSADAVVLLLTELGGLKELALKDMGPGRAAALHEGVLQLRAGRPEGDVLHQWVLRGRATFFRATRVLQA